MSLVAIVALALAFGAVWRVLRFTARRVRLGALIAPIVSYQHTRHVAPRAPGGRSDGAGTPSAPRAKDANAHLDGGAGQTSGRRGRKASDVQSKDRDETWFRDLPRRTRADRPRARQHREACRSPATTRRPHADRKRHSERGRRHHRWKGSAS